MKVAAAKVPVPVSALLEREDDGGIGVQSHPYAQPIGVPLKLRDRIVVRAARLLPRAASATAWVWLDPRISIEALEL